MTLSSSRPQIAEQLKYRALPWSLAHIALNNFFYIWSFGGTTFLLYLDELGLPKDQIGMLLSFFPFTGLVALVLGPMVARWGRKRIYILGFGIRKPVMFTLVFLPWIQAHWGFHIASSFAFGVIFTVAALRAIAETGYYPWLQEFVPNPVRGKFGAYSTILLTLTSIIAVSIASYTLEQVAVPAAFTRLLSAGVGIGLIGVAMMLFVPGGAPETALSHPSRRAYLASLIEALRDRGYLHFLGGMGCYTAGVYLFASYLPLYLKEQVGLLSATIVRLDVAFMLGGAASSLAAGIASDRIGSRPVLIPGLAGSILIPIGWLMAPAFPHAAIAVSTGLYFTFGAASATASIAANRLLFNEIIPPEKNTAYTSIYYAWAGLTGGISPLLGGKLLEALAGWQVGAGIFALDAYRLLFLISLASFSGSLLLYARARPD